MSWKWLPAPLALCKKFVLMAKPSSLCFNSGIASDHGIHNNFSRPKMSCFRVKSLPSSFTSCHCCCLCGRPIMEIMPFRGCHSNAVSIFACVHSPQVCWWVRLLPLSRVLIFFVQFPNTDMYPSVPLVWSYSMWMKQHVTQSRPWTIKDAHIWPGVPLWKRNPVGEVECGADNAHTQEMAVNTLRSRWLIHTYGPGVLASLVRFFQIFKFQCVLLTPFPIERGAFFFWSSQFAAGLPDPTS